MSFKAYETKTGGSVYISDGIAALFGAKVILTGLELEKLNSETEKSIRPLTGNTALSFLLLICFFVAISLWSSIAISQTTTNTSTCDALAIRWDEAPGLGSRLERARALEEQGKSCIGKGIYDPRLAILYMDAGDLNNADRIAKQGIKKGSLYQANLHQILAETTLRRGDVNAAYQMAEDIARKNPEYVPILGFLGEIDSKNQNWAMALKRAQKSNEIDNSALSLLTMAAAFHQLDRHEECIAAVYKALNIEPSRIAKTGGVKEAVFSLGILKRNQEAAELLKRHIRANPNWSQDPSMVNAAKALGLAK